MHFKHNPNRLFEFFAGTPGRPPSLLRKIAALSVTALVFVLALMFSVVLFAVVLTVGAVAWGWLWWKSRALRRQMRDDPHLRPRAHPPGGLVLEGEVIREVRSGEDERR